MKKPNIHVSVYFPQAPKPYSFSYGVEDPHYGPNFQQSEKSDGKNVDGGYTVHLPDGRIQKVIKNSSKICVKNSLICPFLWMIF